MAKKKSVPRRQQAQVKREKKFIDMPKEKLIKICIIAAVVIVLVGVIFWAIPFIDGRLPVEDGVVVTEADNWLVAKKETLRGTAYHKLGSVGDVEGYNRAKDVSLVSDANTAGQTFTPVDENSKITSAYVMTGNGKYDELVVNNRGNSANFFPNCTTTEIEDMNLEGKKAKRFGYSYSVENQPETDEAGNALPATTTYERGEYVYIEAGQGRCIFLWVTSRSQEEAALATQEEIAAEALKIASSVTVD